MIRLSTTQKHRKWWQNRKIDWKKDYLSTYSHPHRLWLADQLKTINFGSIFEIGCGPGANLVPIGLAFPKVMLGGADINPEAIALAQKTFPQTSVFEVASGDNLMMSDNSTDVGLTDMCFIYVGPLEIKNYLREIIRVSRRYVVLVEFYNRSWLKRLKMTLQGRYTHNYPQLLRELGCSDIIVTKIPSELYPNAKDIEYRHLIIART